MSPIVYRYQTIVIAILIKGYTVEKLAESNVLARWLSPQIMAKPEPEGYGLSESTQAKLRMTGRIPYSKISNKYIRYDRREIDKWLENHAVVSV